MKSFSLLPRQDIFYTYLSDLADKARDSAHSLKRYVDNPDAAARKEIGKEILNIQEQARTVMRDLTSELCRSFITPFDREDIQRFSHNLYRIPKTIEKAAKHMELHGLHGAKDDFARQVDLIVEESAAMEDIISDLMHKRNAKQVMEKARLLHELEHKGDDVLLELLGSLFAEGRDVKDLLLRKDIYDLLEKVIDSYRNAAAVTLQIVLKYS